MAVRGRVWRIGDEREPGRALGASNALAQGIHSGGRGKRAVRARRPLRPTETPGGQTILDRFVVVGIPLTFGSSCLRRLVYRLRVMTWLHIQQRITEALQKRIARVVHSEFRRGERKAEQQRRLAQAKLEKAARFRFYAAFANPRLTLARSNPILAGAGSVFNLAGVMDEPIVGLIRPPGVTTADEALQLLPFYEDQAERILDQAERIMQASETILSRKKT